MIIDEDTYLAHYGILRKSGRYPWGSGGPETASNKSFLDMVEGLHKQGLSQLEIAKGLGITTTQLRAAKSIARNEQKQADIAMAQRLKDKGLSNVAIGQKMKLNESTVRSLLAPGQKDKVDVLQTTANMLKDQVAEKKYIDVGSGVEHHIAGVSRTKLNNAIALLREQGYTIHYVKVPQLGTNQQTTITVLAKPDTPYSEVFKNRDKIQLVSQVSTDGGRTFLGIHPPLSISSKRVGVRYAEQGGAEADGVIYVRPGVDDVSMGKSRYAQVRVTVDGSHYLKGMAMYRDDLPAGVDLVFNTNKHNTGNKLDAMKELKKDKDGNLDVDNPFGAVIDRQIIKEHPNGRVEVTSAMNIVNDESNWEKWSRSLSSQFLSKQSRVLAKTQLDMTFERKKNELNEIMSLTNPAVRKKLLEDFADGADSSAVHLKAAALPRQSNHVILPINSLKETEIFAPTFRNGERVVLVRHPHGGTFEIPELTVNNRNQEGRKLIGTDATAAVGIHSKVAARLSGADFDGDTVLVIPNDKKHVKTSPPLDGLKVFDHIRLYPKYEGMVVMDARTKGQEMGSISNLITDMTIKGANTTELAAAVRHSMVVIDAEKHELNWKQSAIDNGIPALAKRYQGRTQGGASTLISRAGSRLDVPNRKPRSAALGGPVDKATGKKVFEPTGETRTDPRGKVILNTFQTTKLAETEDARTLSSGTVIEKVYAEHSNKLKALANTARKAAVNTKNITYSSSANIAYANEVASLNSKLNIALRNAPLERQAQVIGNAIYSQKLQANPEMEASEKKKIKGLALTAARVRTNAKKQRIEITDSEWDAIQAGAISNNKLNQILHNTDPENIKRLATPRSNILMTDIKKQRAQAMLGSGYTQAEVASALGVSVTTLRTSLSN